MSTINTTVAVMDRMLEQLSGCLNAESAKRIAGFKFDDETQERIAALGAKANEGSLTAEELQEYKSCIDFADLVASLKIKARRLLAEQNGGG
jgi:hypothetical protein